MFDAELAEHRLVMLKRLKSDLRNFSNKNSGNLFCETCQSRSYGFENFVESRESSNSVFKQVYQELKKKRDRRGRATHRSKKKLAQLREDGFVLSLRHPAKSGDRFRHATISRSAISATALDQQRGLGPARPFQQPGPLGGQLASLPASAVACLPHVAHHTVHLVSGARHAHHVRIASPANITVSIDTVTLTCGVLTRSHRGFCF